MAGDFWASGRLSVWSVILTSFEEALTLVAMFVRPFLVVRPSNS